MDELRVRVAALVALLLEMFPPQDCAALLRSLADAIEDGEALARSLGPSPPAPS